MYQTVLDRFIPHLQAMAEGLTDPYFSTYDTEDYDRPYSDDDGVKVEYDAEGEFTEVWVLIRTVNDDLEGEDDDD